VTARPAEPAVEPATPAGARRARYPWWMGPAAWLGAAVLHVLGATWRIERTGIEHEREALANGGCIYALWHARLLALVFSHRARGVAVLVSRHRDGELVTRIIARLGFVTARGSSTRGGEEGLREMIEWAGRGRSLSITPDGPRGPVEQVKPGLVYLAGRTGYPVLPVAAATRSLWRLRSWDGFQIPRPFARVVVAYGPPIAVAGGLDRETLERTRGELEAAIAAVTRVADARIAAPERGAA
jgi:lysophospholipid acyltransferase (LPLAT)-like uncharacterized protein